MGTHAVVDLYVDSADGSFLTPVCYSSNYSASPAKKWHNFDLQYSFATCSISISRVLDHSNSCECTPACRATRHRRGDGRHFSCSNNLWQSKSPGNVPRYLTSSANNGGWLTYFPFGTHRNEPLGQTSKTRDRATEAKPFCSRPYIDLPSTSLTRPTNLVDLGTILERRLERRTR